MLRRNDGQFRVVFPSWESRFSHWVVGDVIPILRRAQHFAQCTPEVMNRLPGIILAKLCQKEILDRFTRNVRESAITKGREQMRLENVLVVLLCCVFQCRKHNGFPFLLHEFLQRACRSWPLVPAVQDTKPLRESMHCETACGEFCDCTDHHRPAHSRCCSVCVNDILPPAGNPYLLSFATLKERTSLIPSANHRSSFDGSPGLFCVASQCSRHVKRPFDPRAVAPATPRLLPCRSASIFRGDIRAILRASVCVNARTPRRRELAVARRPAERS